MAHASLKALETADGLCQLRDGVKVGDVYFVDLDQVRNLRWGHTDRLSEEVRESIWIEDAVNGTGKGWMPVELLSIAEFGVGDA